MNKLDAIKNGRPDQKSPRRMPQENEAVSKGLPTKIPAYDIVAIAVYNTPSRFCSTRLVMKLRAVILNAKPRANKI